MGSPCFAFLSTSCSALSNKSIFDLESWPKLTDISNWYTQSSSVDDKPLPSPGSFHDSIFGREARRFRREILNSSKQLPSLIPWLSAPVCMYFPSIWYEKKLHDVHISVRYIGRFWYSEKIVIRRNYDWEIKNPSPSPRSVEVYPTPVFDSAVHRMVGIRPDRVSRSLCTYRANSGRF